MTFKKITSGIFNPQFFVPFLSFVGVLFTIYWSQKSVQKQMRSIYDKESDWTIHLVDVMERQTIFMRESDLLKVKRALRIYKKSDVEPLNIEEIWIFKIFKFRELLYEHVFFFKTEGQRIHKFGDLWNFMTDMSITYLTKLLENIGNKPLTFNEAENVRLIAQTLFANRWEYTQRQNNKSLPQIARNKLGPIFVKTSLKLIIDKEEILNNYVIHNNGSYFKLLFQEAITYHKGEEYDYIIKKLQTDRLI